MFMYCSMPISSPQGLSLLMVMKLSFAHRWNARFVCFLFMRFTTKSSYEESV